MERSRCRLRGDGRGFMMKGKKGVVVSRGEKERIVVVVAVAVVSHVMVKGKS